jgi:uncharacterized protein
MLACTPESTSPSRAPAHALHHANPRIWSPGISSTEPTILINVDLGRPFLTAEWHDLVLLNYEVDPGLLLAYVPRGTELDYWNSKAFISLVGFCFVNTRVLGVRIPFHSNFTEVNLRFYVKRWEQGKARRGVVFIREIVPRAVIAFVARTLYNENYIALPMVHEIRRDNDANGNIEASYRWRLGGGWSELRFHSQGDAAPLLEGSEEQFIAEHYWGYALQRDGGCMEYEVLHPPWKVWQARHAQFTGDIEVLYGPQFADALSGPPASAFLADGSPVTVMRGRRI